MSPLRDQVDGLCTMLIRSAVGEVRARALEIRERLHEPLRVALCGRVKAGKSTLLNALVGERLAATNAAECTKVVGWYRHGEMYEVTGTLEDASQQPLPFRREAGGLHISSETALLERVTRLDVRWPAQILRRYTVLDTPGNSSFDESVRRRALEAMVKSDGSPGDADVIVYLMHHAHQSDVAMLDGILDRTLLGASPVNAIGVLSRPDEIAGGRLDALLSAERIAMRYQNDRCVSRLVSRIVPVAGLLAETAATLRADEFEWLSELASMPTAELDSMLLSADRFLSPQLSPLTSEVRGILLQRLGLFGVRLSLAIFESDATVNTRELSARLLDHSGIGDLRGELDQRFTFRADVLKSRTALASLRRLALASEDRTATDDLRRSIEQIASSSAELMELRLQHELHTAQLDFLDEDLAEAQTLVAFSDSTARLSLAAESSPEQMRKHAQERARYWRGVSNDPRYDRETGRLASDVVRVFERLAQAPVAE